jgi:hypothetical protein
MSYLISLRDEPLTPTVPSGAKTCGPADKQPLQPLISHVISLCQQLVYLARARAVASVATVTRQASRAGRYAMCGRAADGYHLLTLSSDATNDIVWPACGSRQPRTAPLWLRCRSQPVRSTSGSHVWISPAREPDNCSDPAALASAIWSNPVASSSHVLGSVSATLGGVPRVCRGPATH